MTWASGLSNWTTDETGRAHVICRGNPLCKETDRKWEEGGEISVLEFAATEHGRKGKVVASEDVKEKIGIGINKCARESGLDRENFIRKLVRGGSVNGILMTILSAGSPPAIDGRVRNQSTTLLKSWKHCCPVKD
jgi:hypothetical protein